MFSFFNKDKRQAKKLSTLATLTIERMEALLAGLDPNDERRITIDARLKQRRRDLDRYENLVRGERDMSEQIMPTLHNFHIYKVAMEKELGLFMHDADVFCSYLEKIKEKQ